HLFVVVRLDQDFPRLAALWGAEEAVALHHVDEAGGAGEADPHAALEEAGGSLALGDDQTGGLVIEVVVVVVVAASAARSVVGRLEDVWIQLGLALLLEPADEARGLLLRDVGAVETDDPRGAGRHHEHVALAEELLRADLIEDGPRIVPA